MNTKKTTLLGLSIGAIFVVLVFSISLPNAIADPIVDLEPEDFKGSPDLKANLYNDFGDASDSDAVGVAHFWFDNDKNPKALKYKIILNKIHLNSETNKKGTIDEYLTKIHIHWAPEGDHTAMHLYNILGPDDDEDNNDGFSANNGGHITVVGVWDDPDVWENWEHHLHHSTKPLNGIFMGDTIRNHLCNGNTDINIHTAENGAPGAIRGVLDPVSPACKNL